MTWHLCRTMSLWIVAWTAMLVWTPPSSAIAQGAPKLVVRENAASRSSLEAAVAEIEQTKWLANVFWTPSDYFYEVRGLPLNAIVCGDLANTFQVKLIARIFIENGVQLRYVGPYVTDEVDSYGNVIDVRAVGDQSFNTKIPPITVERLEAGNFSCGRDIGVSVMSRGLFGF